jgi:molecular chaperone DnaK (HSP70)
MPVCDLLGWGGLFFILFFCTAQQTLAPLAAGNVTLVGRAARAQMQDNAENTLYEFKRFIGKPFSQVATDKELSRFPFVVVNQSGRPMFRIAVAYAALYAIFIHCGYSRPVRSGDTDGHRLVRPEDASAAILRTLTATAQRHIGGAPLRKAVLAVPVEFSVEQVGALSTPLLVPQTHEYAARGHGGSGTVGWP